MTGNGLFVMALLLWSLVGREAAQAVERVTDDNLYRAETIVTGTGEAERARGFRVGIEQVLVKLTGNATLAESEALSAWHDRAAGLIAAFSYEDRMKGIPVHDEQGTRDRPHYLRMQFAKERIDAAMAAAGLRKWRADRPLIALWLGIQDARSRYVLAAAGPQGYGQRAVLEETSALRGVPIVLPKPDSHGIGYETIAAGALDELRAASAALGAGTVLFGTLDFDGLGTWNMAWTLFAKGEKVSWALESVTFDAALKSGIEEAAGILSNPPH